MTRPKARLGLLVLVLVASGLAAVTSSPASGDPGAQPIEAAQLDGSAGPASGFSGHGPEVAAPEGGSPVVPIEATPAGAESVIGADGRVQVTNTTSPAAFPIGQIEFVQDLPQPNNGENFICTGWLIDSNTIVSAGHCAFDPNNTSPGFDPIIESATWYPGRNGVTNPAGGCPVNAVWAPPTEWVQNGQAYYDFSVMNFANPGPCQDIDATTGTYGLYANPTLNALNNAQVTVQGYPGDKPFGTHWKMNGRITKANKRFTFYPMDTFGGQSGSPVWHQRTAGSCVGRCAYAIHAYGTCGPPSTALCRTNNGGPRITAFRIGQILDIADNNGV